MDEFKKKKRWPLSSPHLILPAGEHSDQADWAKPVRLYHSQHLHKNHIGFNVLAGALDTGTAQTVKGSVPAWLNRLFLALASSVDLFSCTHIAVVPPHSMADMSEC